MPSKNWMMSKLRLGLVLKARFIEIENSGRDIVADTRHGLGYQLAGEHLYPLSESVGTSTPD